MKCNKCGHLVDADAKFCTVCGESLDTEPCHNCGTLILKDAKFCSTCGHSTTVDKTKSCPSCGFPCKEHQNFCPKCGNNVVVKENIEVVEKTKVEEVTQEEVIDISQEETLEAKEEQLLKEHTSIEEQPVTSTSIPLEEVKQPIQQKKETNYFKNPIVWIISGALLLISILLMVFYTTPQTSSRYGNNNRTSGIEPDPIIGITVSGSNNGYVRQSNINNGGGAFYDGQQIYLCLDDYIRVYDSSFNNEVDIISADAYYLHVDDKYMYYSQDLSEYIRYNRDTEESEVLLEYASAPQHIGEKIYYGDSNHHLQVYNIETKENVTLTDFEVWNFTIDTEKGHIIYMNQDSQLLSMDLEGNNPQELIQSEIYEYVYDGTDIYYSTYKPGLTKYNIETKDSTTITKDDIYHLALMEEYIVYVDEYDAIYIIDKDGEESTLLTYTSDLSRLWIVGDCVLYYTSNDYSAFYQIVDMDGNNNFIYIFDMDYSYDDFDYDDYDYFDDYYDEGFDF